jgi:mono/diheme cytochrome c family protein
MAVTPTEPAITSLLPDTIAGSVSDESGAVAEATVRIQATQNSTLTDAEGHFILSGLTPGEKVTVSAWKEGYYCALVQDILPPVDQVKLDLRSVQINDNPNYEWIPPTGNNSCYSCKPGVTQVWLDNDAHGKSAVNPRFLGMYNGTDIHGNQSPATQYVTVKDYGTVPMRPDLSKAYYGPGYKLDFPNTAGNCAACHTPGAAIADPYGTDPNKVSGADAFGVHCDFCHKIGGVSLDPQTNTPNPNMPGVLSMDIRRPFPEDKERYQLFFGTFDDDNVPMEDTRLPLIEQSQFCAPCHFGAFWDTVVYNSYGEWLESPYSNPKTGKTCQQCHTPGPTILNGEKLSNVAPGKGGVERDPATIHAHTFPGAANVELLKNSITLAADASMEGGQATVTVSITNDKTGHHVPTDSPLRHLILLVEASDDQDKPLVQTGGDVLPEWCGKGDPQEGNYAGLPGKTYAKLLQELWTEITPALSAITVWRLSPPIRLNTPSKPRLSGTSKSKSACSTGGRSSN